MDAQGEISSERNELALQLETNGKEIETRWLRRVSQELNRHGLSTTELRNSIPDYIQGLVAALRHHNDTTIRERGVEAWAVTAQQHALTRIELGFDIDELLQEFLILREVILEVLGEAATLSVHETERVNTLIGQPPTPGARDDRHPPRRFAGRARRGGVTLHLVAEFAGVSRVSLDAADEAGPD